MTGILIDMNQRTEITTTFAPNFGWFRGKSISESPRPKFYCNDTLPGGGMYWKISPPRIERFVNAGILHPEARENLEGQIKIHY